MIAPRLLVVALLLGPALGLSCYSEQLPPPTYRYPCDGDGECSADEVCRRGLCERPCTQAELFAAVLVAAEDQPCPFEQGYVGCYNGACVSPCDLGSDYCPQGQACLDVGLGSSGGGFGGASTPIGACMLECDGDDSELCLETETCEEGVCTPIDCEDGDPCPDGYTCFFGSCSAVCSGGQACPEGNTCDAFLGVCTLECSPECAEGTTCYFGSCATDCTEDRDCPDDLICLAGVCLLEDLLPDGIGTSSGTTGTTGTTGDGTDDGTTGDGTADAGATDGASTTDDASSTGMAVDAHEENLR